MSIFRQYIAPLLTLIIFLIALVAVSARAFLPGDMAAPAPSQDNNNVSSDVAPNNLDRFTQTQDSLPGDFAKERE